MFEKELRFFKDHQDELVAEHRRSDRPQLPGSSRAPLGCSAVWGQGPWGIIKTRGAGRTGAKELFSPHPRTVDHSSPGHRDRGPGLHTYSVLRRPKVAV